jgi:molybdopterin/thiamine biosynthesis adenylyltransferase
MTDRKRLDRHLDPGAVGSPVRSLPGLSGSPGHVQVIVGGADAATGRGQLLTWAVVNLLLRCYGVLDSVTVTCADAPLAAALPLASAGNAPRMLHEALNVLARATAEPSGTGPRLVIRTGSGVPRMTASAVTLVIGTEYARTLAETTQAGPAWLVAAGAWKLAVVSPSAISAGLAVGLPRLDEAGPISVAVWLGAALACGEVFKHVGRIREGKGRLIEAFSVNLWTLSGSDGFAELAGPSGPARPPLLPAHYVVGAGAVAEAYLAVLASSDIATAVALLDDDVLGDTNLNRHILAGWADIGELKALLARDRLAGSRTKIFPVNARWDAYLAVAPAERPARPGSLAADEATGCYRLVVSAVDRNDSRISIAAARPQVILGGSTNGLQAEVGRYWAGSGWQCLACGSLPEPMPSIEQATADLVGLSPADLEAVARERNLDLDALRDYLRRPECGTLGEREVRRFAAFTQPDWSVSFVSAASGALLAARALTHAAREDTVQTQAEGDTIRLWMAAPAISRTAHRPYPGCPVCGTAATAVPCLNAAAVRTDGRQVFRPRPGGPRAYVLCSTSVARFGVRPTGRQRPRSHDPRSIPCLTLSASESARPTRPRTEYACHDRPSGTASAQLVTGAESAHPSHGRYRPGHRRRPRGRRAHPGRRRSRAGHLAPGGWLLGAGQAQTPDRADAAARDPVPHDRRGPARHGWGHVPAQRAHRGDAMAEIER